MEKISNETSKSRSGIKEEPLTFESLFIKLNNTDRIHLMRINRDPDGEPVLMLHGAIENGRIFYNEKGRGLAPFLANHGYDVFVADLRGRGMSTPHVSRYSDYGQRESITEEIPAFMKRIRELKGDVKQHWICHSWGGVLATSHLVRFPENIKCVKSLVYFGTKRRVSVHNFHRFIFIDIVWRFLFTLIGRVCGYVPAAKLGFGTDDESRLSHRGCVKWVEEKSWIDPQDGFDYGKAALNATIPAALYFAARNDHSLGHPSDVLDFINESGEHKYRYILLSRGNGHLHNYDHVSMVTHSEAPSDHFPAVLQWLKK